MSFRAARSMCACLLFVFPLAAAAADPPPAAADPRVERFLQRLETERDALKIPGMSVAILADGGELHLGGTGFADFEAKVPATADTEYPIASVTKTFAAVVAHRLAEQGKLDLEAPVSKWIPAITDDRVRVKHLLSHTSGSNSPGTYFSYDPARFEHLAKILEAAGGKSLRVQVVELILEPLRMRDTIPGADIADDPTRWSGTFGKANVTRWQAALERVAKPYTMYGDGEILRTSFPPSDFAASAGLVSTVRDLAKYDIGIDEHELLKADTLARAWTPFTSTAGRPLPMGLGWYATDYRGERLVWHFGHWGTGYSALYLKVPARKLTLILLANSEALADHHYKVGEDVSHDRFACAFLDTFVPDVANRPGAAALPQDLPAQITAAPSADCAHTSRVALERWQADRKAKAKTIVAMDPELAAAVAGEYELPGRTATITNEGGRLFIDFPAGLRSELHALSANELFVKVRPWTWTVVREGDEVARLDIGEPGSVFQAKRLE